MDRQKQRAPVDLSRDDAREIGVIALLFGVGLRVAAGVVLGLQETTHAYTWRSITGQFLASVDATMGLLALAATLLIVLSPTASVSPRLLPITRRIAGAVTLLGVAAALFAIENQATLLSGIWLALRNGTATSLLAGSGWWILRNFNNER